MYPVTSTSLAEIGYDVSRRQLYVRFREDSALYRYDGVPPEVWEAFAAAPSKGAYHNRVIRLRYAWCEIA